MIFVKSFFLIQVAYHFSSLMMLKIVNKSHSPHVLKTTLAQHRARRPQESIGVVPAKDLPKVKLESFSQLQSVRIRVNYAYLVYDGLVVFIVAQNRLLFPEQKDLFLMEKILINFRILWDSFHIGSLLTKGYRRAQGISIQDSLEFTQAMWVPPGHGICRPWAHEHRICLYKRTLCHMILSIRYLNSSFYFR